MKKDANHIYGSRLAHVQGLLTHLQTTDSRRRYDQDEDLLVPDTDPFLIDADVKIARSKAHRRLAGKTQVVTHPYSAHIRSRGTHTDEVVSVAVQIADILGLNVSLVRAMALGHDIGHTPFGHSGEEFISKVTGKVFRHEVMSVVVAQYIERKGVGLNLNHHVLLGMLQHSRGKGDMVVGGAMTPEARVVMYADKIAYITADFNDFFRLGVSLPPDLVRLMGTLGDTQRQRTNCLVAELCLESADRKVVVFDQYRLAKTFAEIKQLMYQVYPRLGVDRPDLILGRIYEFVKRVEGEIDPALILALMTDQDVMYLSSQQVLGLSHLQQTSVWELLPSLRNRLIEWWEPDLAW